MSEPGSLALLRAVLDSSPDMVELPVSKGAKSSAEILAWAERQDRPDVARFVIEKISRTMTAPGTQATLTFWRKI